MEESNDTKIERNEGKEPMGELRLPTTSIFQGD